VFFGVLLLLRLSAGIPRKKGGEGDTSCLGTQRLALALSEGPNRVSPSSNLKA
jgi:hypothetical protein